MYILVACAQLVFSLLHYTKVISHSFPKFIQGHNINRDQAAAVHRIGLDDSVHYCRLALGAGQGIVHDTIQYTLRRRPGAWPCRVHVHGYIYRVEFKAGDGNYFKALHGVQPEALAGMRPPAVQLAGKFNVARVGQLGALTVPGAKERCHKLIINALPVSLALAGRPYTLLQHFVGGNLGAVIQHLALHEAKLGRQHYGIVELLYVPPVD